MESGSSSLIVRDLGEQPYVQTWEKMQRFTNERTETTQDECWLVTHPPVYTLGQAGKREHILAPGDIDIVKSDRGGQVTYHGPGQLVCYLMINLRRRHLGVRDLVTGIENSIIKLLHQHGIEALARKDAPGVYVEGRKLASLGLRVRKGSSYHGLSLNVDMDLAPFKGINPCGYEGLEVTDLRRLGMTSGLQAIGGELVNLLRAEFGYDGGPPIQVS